MKRSRFSEEQIIGILREAEVSTGKGGCAAHDIGPAACMRGRGSSEGWKSAKPRG